MGTGASAVPAGDKFLNEIIAVRPDLQGKTEKEILAVVRADLIYAKQARDMMPLGYMLEEHDKCDGSDSLMGVASKIGHICRVVKDADVSVKFYQNVVGARLLNRPQFGSNGFWLWLGNVQLHLIQSELVVRPDHPDGGTNVNHISFDVTDLDECETRLKTAAIEYKKVFVPVGDNKGIRQIFFQDPDFHWIELCDCYKMNDFIYGKYDETRAKEMARFYHEGVDMKGAFLVSVILELMGGSGSGASGDGLKRVFDVYAGPDGKISGDDMLTILRKMEAHTDETSGKNLLNELDTDGSGFVSYKEFVEFVSKQLASSQNEELIQDMFNTLDRNSTGSVTQQEFADFAKAMGLSAPDTFATADTSADRTIDLKEFTNLFGDAQEKLKFEAAQAKSQLDGPSVTLIKSSE